MHKITHSKITISGWNVWTVNLMNQPIKVQHIPKLLSQRLRKCYYKTLGSSISNCSQEITYSLLKFNGLHNLFLHLLTRRTVERTDINKVDYRAALLLKKNLMSKISFGLIFSVEDALSGPLPFNKWVIKSEIRIH